MMQRVLLLTVLAAVAAGAVQALPLSFLREAEGKTMHPQAGDLSAFLGLNPRARFNVPEFRRALVSSLSQDTDKWFEESESIADLLNAASSAWGESKPLGAASEHPYLNIIPQYVGRVKNADDPNSMLSAEWEGRCFGLNKAEVTDSNDDGSFTITFTTRERADKLCSESYWLMTADGLQTLSLNRLGETTVTWTPAADASDAEKYDLESKGVRIFRFLEDKATLMANLVETFKMFTPLFTQGVPPNAAEVNLDFMASYPQFSMEPRDESLSDIPDESEIHSGDFFGVIRLDGLDPMLAWAMGSTTGHTTVALWDDGELYVAESTVLDSYWPTDGVQRTPYRQWIKQAHAAGFNVVHVPLSEEARAMFSEESANEYFKSVEGLEYGYFNMFWGWIDTTAKNYPCLPPDYESNCLQWEFLEPAFALLDRSAPELVDVFVNQAFNLRLGTTGLRTAELYQEAESRGLETRDIPTLVEQDDWVYQTTRYGEPTEGPSSVCCVFVCHIWKAAGIFSNLDDEVNCGEQTNVDDYALDIFEDSYTQILGDYTLTLNDFMTRTPYVHMSESCPSFAPEYAKPDDC